MYALLEAEVSPTVNFLYLAILYLVEAVIAMPSLRNNVLDLFNLAAGTFWEWPVCEMHVLYSITSLIPKFKILAASEILVLSIASYHYFFNTKIVNSKFGRYRGRFLSFYLC